MSAKTRGLILYFILTAAFLSNAPFVSAEPGEPRDPKYLFYKANDHYEEADYDGAIAEYEKLLGMNYESGNLYYNLGNAYFKKNELGEAILSYERAKRLIPRDGDLESNYKYARSLVETTVRAPQKIWPLRFIERMLDRFTVNEATIFISSLYIVITLILIISIFVRNRKRYFLIILSALIIIFLIASASLAVKIISLKGEAVIIARKAEAKFEPFERATTHFDLYEGMKVDIISSKDEWDKIERADGKAGWVKKSALEAI